MSADEDFDQVMAGLTRQFVSELAGHEEAILAARDGALRGDADALRTLAARAHRLSGLGMSAWYGMPSSRALTWMSLRSPEDRRMLTRRSLMAVARAAALNFELQQLQRAKRRRRGKRRMINEENIASINRYEENPTHVKIFLER